MSAPSLRSSIVALVVWTAVAAGTTTARAAPATFVALEYETAPDSNGCPDAGDFQKAVKRQLGYDPFRSAAERHVAVRIAQKKTGFDGWIKWSDARGRWVGDRRLSSQKPECNEIAANVAFAVAVQIQLLAALAPEGPNPSAPSTARATSPSATGKSAAGSPPPPSSNDGSPPTNSQPAPSDVASPPAAPPPANDTAPAPAAGSSTQRRARFRLSVGVGPSLALGLAPQVTGVGRIFVSGRIDPVSLELAVDAALPASQKQADGSGFSLGRIAAGVAACGHVQAFAGCLTGTLGRLEASGSGVDRPLSSSGLFSQIGARLAATHEFGERYFAGVRVEGLVMLSPWTVTLNDEVAWTTPLVGALLGLDFGANFF